MACLCHEISNTESDIQILDEAISSLAPITGLITDIKSELSNISSGTAIYVSPNNLEELVLNINKFYDDRETEAVSIVKSCETYRQLLDNRLIRYKKEDQEFHEEEREKLEEEERKKFIGPPNPNFR